MFQIILIHCSNLKRMMDLPNKLKWIHLYKIEVKGMQIMSGLHKKYFYFRTKSLQASTIKNAAIQSHHQPSLKYQKGRVIHTLRHLQICEIT